MMDRDSEKKSAWKERKWKLVFTLIIGVFLFNNLAAGQIPPSIIFEFSDAQISSTSDGDVYALNDGHILTFHFAQNPQVERESDYLVVHEFDSCHLIQSSAIQIEPLYGLRTITDFKHKGDSIYIIGRGGRSPGLHSYSESMILTLNRKTLQGSYRYFRAEEGMCLTSMDFTSDGGMACFGYYSNVNGPSKSVAFLLNKSYEMTISKEFAPTYTFTGNITTLPDQNYLIRTAENLIIVDENFNQLWNRKFDRPVTGERTYVEADGIVFLLYGWYGDNELQVYKIDFDGNLIWSSPRLNAFAHLDGNARLLRTESGFIVVHQAYDFKKVEGNVEVSYLSKVGSVTAQYGVELSKDSTNFEWLREADYKAGFLWFMTTNENRDFRLYRISEGSPICGLAIVDYQNEDTYTWLYEDDPIPMNNRTYIRGKYNVHPEPISIDIRSICVAPYPLYDLIPDQVELCEGIRFEVQLDTIDDYIFWVDDFTGENRSIYEVGEYAYGYGVCQTELAESIQVSIKDCSCDVYIPTGFSPNNDGVNDVFSAFIPCEYATNKMMQIYDRWGSLVFESSNSRETWDGIVNQKRCPEGVYVYHYQYLNVGFKTPREVHLKGEVNIFR